MPPQSDLDSDPEQPAPTGDATPPPAGQAPPAKAYAAGYVHRLPAHCFCRKSKIRYRAEAEAVAAAGHAAEDLGLPFSVYRCPRSRVWHKATRGFHPRELVTNARLIAYHLTVRRVIDRNWLSEEILSPDASAGSRKRYRQAIQTMLAEGLIEVDGRDDRLLRAVDDAGLRRVIQVGLDGWRAERGEA